ncbi:MAG: serine/threonine protein kinase [Planctomycetota bacterium]|jgi:serine/threonine protein kinase
MSEREPGRKQEPFNQLERAIDDFLASAPVEQIEGFDGLPDLGELESLPLSKLKDFKLVSKIGRGAMGIVYEARQATALNRSVAIKVLPALVSSESRQRFRREATAALALDHPSIVKVLAADVDGEQPFMAMELVRGLSLDRILQSLREEPKRPATTAALQTMIHQGLDAAEAASASAEWPTSYDEWIARLGIQLAAALQHAHDRGIVHRDVKPGNVMITPEGRAILLDFGIASFRSSDAMTMTGDFLGTLHYCAPEQVNGDSVDGRADIYSLGASLYELLSLKRPHESSSTGELVHKLVNEDAERLGSDVPRNLRAICSRALSRSPRHRFGTAAALAQDLRAHLLGEPISIRSRNPFLYVVAGLRKHRRLSLALLVLLTFLLTLEIQGIYRAQAAGRNASVYLGSAKVSASELTQLLRSDVHWIANVRSINRVDFGEFERRRSRRESVRERFLSASLNAERELERAIDRNPRYGDARNQLATLYALHIKRALEDHADLLDPNRLLVLEDKLTLYDNGDHRALLSRAGWVTVNSEPKAQLRIVDAQDKLVFDGSTGPHVLRLEEGSYVANLSCVGREAVDLPFFVRREAADLDQDAERRREHHVTLLELKDLAEGFVYVPAGWTLVEDSPPRWVHVESFQIQRNETTYAEWLQWFRSPLGEDWRTDKRLILPRYGPAPGEAHVQRNPLSDEWELKVSDAQADWPLRGLTPMELAEFAGSIERPRIQERDAWFTALPTLEEWTRAARGGDGRQFPWGNSFSWQNCGGYSSRGAEQGEPFPYQVGSFRSDLSPFGVSGMAGSIAELTSHASFDRLGELTICGGSYRGRLREDMKILNSRRIPNRTHTNVGLRIVRRQLPTWLRSTESVPASFQDDFDQPDGAGMGAGWKPVRGQIASGLASTTYDALTYLREGWLVCKSESGNFCESGIVWRRVDPGLRYTLRLRCRLHVIDLTTVSSCGITLGPQIHSAVGGVGVAFAEGQLLLRVGCEAQTGEVEGFSNQSALELELRVDGRSVEVRSWNDGGQRPALPVLAGSFAGELQPPRLLSVIGPGPAGGVFEVDHIEIHPLQ